jgi:hypothetical protein
MLRGLRMLVWIDLLGKDVYMLRGLRMSVWIDLLGKDVYMLLECSPLIHISSILYCIPPKFIHWELKLI